VWAYLMLRETAQIREHQKLDIWGNITFALGLTISQAQIVEEVTKGCNSWYPGFSRYWERRRSFT